MFFKHRLSAASLICILVLFGCGKSDQSSPPPTTASADGDMDAAPKVGVTFVTRDDYKPVVGTYGGRLVRATISEPKTFNPVTGGETSTTDYTDRMFYGLTKEDPFTGEIIPLMAESWTTSEDGLSWTFKLRKDIVFNDGSPLTAADVVFTWNDLIYDLRRPAEKKDPRWPCSMRDVTTIQGKIVKVEQVDDYTVKFTTPIKYAVWNRYAGYPVLSKKKYERLAIDGTFGGALGTDSKPEDLVGAGPWMLGSYVRGQKVTLKRNPNFWQKDAAGNKLPYLDEQVWLSVRDINADLLNFQQKVTDVHFLMSGKEVPVLKPLQQSDNFTLYQHGADYSNLFLMFNMNLDSGRSGKVADYKINWFRDKRFRQAASYAVDRRAIVQNIYRGLGYPLSTLLTRTVGQFSYPDIKPYPHDIEKAKALLAEMGLKDTDGDGFLDDGKGHKVAFTLTTNAGNTVREETIDFIRKDLQKVGMDVNILPLEFNLLIDKLDNTYDWEAMVMGFTGGREPHDGANMWFSWGRSHEWWPQQKTPSFEWEKQIDEIFAQGISELDKEKRKQIYRKWIELIHEEEPLIYLVARERVIALRNKFGNIFPSPSPGGGAPEDALLHNEEEIFVKDAAARTAQAQ